MSNEKSIDKDLAKALNEIAKAANPIKWNDLDDYQFAVVLLDWMAAATLRWDVFTDQEKEFFRALEIETCRRFINQQLPEEMEELNE